MTANQETENGKTFLFGPALRDMPLKNDGMNPLKIQNCMTERTLIIYQSNERQFIM